MSSSEETFLILCEELNFTRAAERCFMSQQGISSHIRKLEEQYRTKLFYRNPAVAPTESGKALREALLKRRAIEEDLERTIREIDEGSRGTVTFGINSTRASFLGPRILEVFCPAFPEVIVNFITGDTVEMSAMLRRGELDGLIGVNTVPDPELLIEPVMREPVCLIVQRPTAMLRGYDPGREVPDPVGAFQELPFVRNARGSTLNTLVDQYLADRGIVIRNAASISNYGVQLALCRFRNMGLFCPGSIAFQSSGPAHDPAFAVFEIPSLSESLEVALVSGKDRNYPACVKVFFRTVTGVLKNTPVRQGDLQ